MNPIQTLQCFQPLHLHRILASATLSLAAIPALQAADSSFQHLASFDVTRNRSSDQQVISRVAEIVDVTEDGLTLVYTDSASQLIGYVDISDPANPQPAGVVNVGGEPTSVAVHGGLALAGVNTSTMATIDCDGETVDYIADWSGKLVVIDNTTRAISGEIDLGGQPDSIAVSPDGRYAAVVIENERNEDIGSGLIPQGAGQPACVDGDLIATGAPMPGKLVIVDLNRWSARDAQTMIGLPGLFAADDPEPEFVDINAANQAVVTLQENNHIVIFDLPSGAIRGHFPAGSVDLTQIDTVEDDLIQLNTAITKRREPDAVTWIGNRFLATANEGDYEDALGEEGGSRGFTVFDTNGNVVFESYASFEHELVRLGHYNEGRSENKGVEPEAVEYGYYGRQHLLFVGSERSNAVGVYRLSRREGAQLLQVLPTGIGPEGLKAIPARELFIAATETAVFDAGIPTMINIFAHQNAPAGYPGLVSANDANGLPIPWVALSDLVADPVDPHRLYSVSDSFLAKGFVYSLDVSQQPAVITSRLEVNTTDALDLEGIAVGADGTFWLGSEGQTPGGRDNLVLQVDPNTGNVLRTIPLPADLVDQRRGNGIEGIAVTGAPGNEQVYVAIQRAWPDEGDLDQVQTKIGRYEVASGQWGFVHYPQEPEGNGGWIGLSGITAFGQDLYVIERDKGWGDSSPPNAELKAIFRLEMGTAQFKPYGQSLDTIGKTLVANLTDQIAANSVWTAEKLEGFAIAVDGQAYAVTDNDGVDDAPGETVFLRLGELLSLGQ
ncbi:esterase-like activity of phytase family protein [Rhabdochromatium marinum]|uniref:esterase-like activity of phytase family protein n=1 Tax=Rhabdochromatium marinum TaxID=48729 RepID=UPI001904F9C7|nr:esterase-like activity of phytase family protein [Rhabdochromatium marinum]